MINIEELTQKDIGRWVEYNTGLPIETETGRVKSWNDTYIFVVYKCDQQWERFQDFTGAATDPQDLKFLDTL
jgi:putative NIF3 family GTP cyclohydrolase 1 type 2